MIKAYHLRTVEQELIACIDPLSQTEYNSISNLHNPIYVKRILDSIYIPSRDIIAGFLNYSTDTHKSGRIINNPFDCRKAKEIVDNRKGNSRKGKFVAELMIGDIIASAIERIIQKYDHSTINLYEDCLKQNNVNSSDLMGILTGDLRKPSFWEKLFSA